MKLLKPIMMTCLMIVATANLTGCGKASETFLGGDPANDVNVTGDGNVVSVGGKGNTTTSTTITPATPETPAENIHSNE